MKKTLSILLTVCMIISLSACNKASQQNVQTTTSYTTEVGKNGREVKDPDLEVDDGQWQDEDDTNTMVEPATEKTTTGLHTYTVYGDIQLSMDVNIDDWIGTNSSGQEFFKYDRLAQSLGWLPEDQDLESFGDGSAFFYTYKTGDKTVGIRLYGNTSWGDAPGYKYPQIYGINYLLGRDDENTIDDIDVMTDKGDYVVVNFQKHYDDIKYSIAGMETVMASRDDIIVLAYMLYNIKRYADKNPFDGTDLLRYKIGYIENESGEAKLELP